MFGQMMVRFIVCKNKQTNQQFNIESLNHWMAAQPNTLSPFGILHLQPEYNNSLLLAVFSFIFHYIWLIQNENKTKPKMLGIY